MYKAQNKEAVVVDLGSTTNSATLVEDTIVNIGGADGVKSQASKTFTQAANIDLSSSKMFAVGLAMPAIGRRDNINLSFNAFASYRVGTGSDEIDGENWVQLKPFIARTTNVTTSAITVENVHYLPFQSKWNNIISVSTNVVVADLGYGHDLRDKGVCIGLELKNLISSTVSIQQWEGSLASRYNYAPIKTLDKEL